MKYKVSFYLARPKSKTPTVILARLKIKDEQVRFGTGLSILPKHWNKEKQRVKTSVKNAASYNTLLRTITNDLTDIYIELENQHIRPTAEAIHRRYKELLIEPEAAVKNAVKNALEHFQNWLDQSKHKKTEQTIKLYTSAKSILEAFETHSKDSFTLDGMDRGFLESFVEYLYEKRKLQNSTVWQHVKTWKAFMEWAYTTGLTRNEFHRSVKKKDFHVRQHHVVRLSEEEVEAFANVDLSHSKALINARDLFVLQCWLGVRVSDLLKIVKDPEAYSDGEVLRIRTQKNRKPVIIPLHPTARKILLGDNPPYVISDVKLNKHIKEVAQLAGLDRKITETKDYGAKTVETTAPLYKVISTHVAKKTFVSLMTARGVSLEVIKAITGNTRESLTPYLSLNESEIIREMQKAAA